MQLLAQESSTELKPPWKLQITEHLSLSVPICIYFTGIKLDFGIPSIMCNSWHKTCIDDPAANITQTVPPYFGIPSKKAIQLILSSINFSYPTSLPLPLWNVHCEQHLSGSAYVWIQIYLWRLSLVSNILNNGSVSGNHWSVNLQIKKHTFKWSVCEACKVTWSFRFSLWSYWLWHPVML
jgi:hypothetical protein